METAKTDANGAFRTPAWSQEQAGDYKLKHYAVRAYAYKANYTFERASELLLHVRRFDGPPSERIQYLLRTIRITSCASQSASDKNQLPLLRVLHDEAVTLPPSADKDVLLEAIQYQEEILELGYEEASSRHLKRNKKRTK
jgi:hypothetical protein